MYNNLNFILSKDKKSGKITQENFFVKENHPLVKMYGLKPGNYSLNNFINPSIMKKYNEMIEQSIN